MDFLAHIALGFSSVLQPMHLLLVLLGAVLGTAIGVLPGISPSLAIALLLPATFQLTEPTGAFILFGGILAFSTLGVYSLNRNPIDLIVMFAIGVMGFLLRLFRFPLAPLILGLVLGPMLETELRRALIGSRGDWTVLVDRPIAAVILVVTAIVIALPVIGALRRRTSATVAQA